MSPLEKTASPQLPLCVRLDACLLDTVLSASDDQIYVLDALGRFLYVCMTGAAMLGLRRDAMLGLTGQMLGIKPEFQNVLDRERERVLATGRAGHGDLQMTTSFGPREYSYTFAPLAHAEQEPRKPKQDLVVCTARDVTERNRARRQAAGLLTETQKARERLAQKYEELAQAHRCLEEANLRLHEMATRDGLTGLLNHRAFLERLGEEFGRAVRHDQPLSLLLLDIDHFKRYNDAHGHPAGDAALQQVAHVLRSVTRETDTIARCGGEEFFVVLPQTNLDGALIMAERIRRGIEDSKEAGYSITVSIGTCMRQAQTESPASLISIADQALYRAKAAGRNQVCHERLT